MKFDEFLFSNLGEIGKQVPEDPVFPRMPSINHRFDARAQLDSGRRPGTLSVCPLLDVLYHQKLTTHFIIRTTHVLGSPNVKDGMEFLFR
ncbi:unnamed protein product [Cylicostephanus goldi]|uniref:Uncharacterized protein n=1 Tax=Cylicostephanus goldi TaxID=71465 RepID=A0A3P6SPK5_CYLGO|nr:unnamed protein product [Cylicostephanus goldi]